MNKEETQMMAFQLIGFAGDAFSHFFQAIDAAKKADYEEAERLIQEGKKSMKEAHDAQTDLLSGRSRRKRSGLQHSHGPCAGSSDHGTDV